MKYVRFSFEAFLSNGKMVSKYSCRLGRWLSHDSFICRKILSSCSRAKLLCNSVKKDLMWYKILNFNIIFWSYYFYYEKNIMFDINLSKYRSCSLRSRNHLTFVSDLMNYQRTSSAKTKKNMFILNTLKF